MTAKDAPPLAIAAFGRCTARLAKNVKRV